jgi:hypothetical protein
LRKTKGAKKIPKTVLKIGIKIKETTYTLVFRKHLFVFFRCIEIYIEATQLGHFHLFLEDSLSSEACRAGKNLKTDLNSTHHNQAKIVDFFLIRQNRMG